MGIFLKFKRERDWQDHYKKNEARMNSKGIINRTKQTRPLEDKQ